MIKKRLLSVILAALMVLGTVITVTPKVSADVEGVYNVTSYGEIEAILEEDGDAKIVLNSDIEEIFSSDEWDTIKSEITLGEGNKILDLNGYDLYVKDEVNKEDQGSTCNKPTMNLFCIPENASLTVTDENPNVLTDLGSITFDAYIIGYSTNPVTLSFDPGHFTCVAVRNIFLVEKDGELTVENGKFECGREKEQHLTEAHRVSFAAYEPGVNDTSFTDCITYKGDDNYEHWHSHDAYQVVFGAPIVVDGGKVTVNDGHFIARGCSRSNMLCNWSLYMLNKSNIGDFCRAGIMITGKNSDVDINGGLFHGTDGAQALFISEKIRDTISLDIYAGTFITTRGVEYIRCTEALGPTRRYAKMFRAYTYVPTQYIRGEVRKANEELVILDNIFARGISAYTSNLRVVATPKITSQSTNESCVVNDTLTIFVKAENATSYSWQKYDEMGNAVGKPVTGKSDGTFEVTSDIEGIYVYKCTVRNAQSSTVSEPVNVTFTAESKSYGVWVHGKELTTEDHGNLAEDGYTYDEAENTLILCNFIDTKAYQVKGTIYSTIYSANGALNVSIKGDNVISNTTSSGSTYYGLYAIGNINIYGSGKICIALDTDKASTPFTGIYTPGGQVKFWEDTDVVIEGGCAKKSFTGILAYNDVWFDGDGQTRINCSSTLGATNNTGVAIINGTELKDSGKGVIKYVYGHVAISANGKAFRPVKGYTEFDELRYYDIKVDGKEVNRKDDTAISKALNATANAGVDITYCEYYDIYVNGVEVSDYTVFGKCKNGGYWSYDINNNVLYLSNAQITNGTAISDYYKSVCGIYTTRDDLDICINGDCSIDFSDRSSVSAVCGICSTGNLNLIGTGDLTVSSKAKAVNMYTGINCSKLLTLDRTGTVKIDFADKTDKNCAGVMYTSEVLCSDGEKTYLGGLLCKKGDLISVVGNGKALWDWGENGDKFLTEGYVWRSGDSETDYTLSTDIKTAYTSLSGSKYAAILENNALNNINVKMDDFPQSSYSKLTAGSESVILAETEDYTLKTASEAGYAFWKLDSDKADLTSTYTAGEKYYTYLEMDVKNPDLQIEFGKTYTFTINGSECEATVSKCSMDKSNYTFKVICICPEPANEKIALTDENVIISGTSFTYNGSVNKPTVVKITDKFDNVLTENTDYTVSYSADCKNAGKYYLTVTGKGEYEGTVKKEFEINAQTLAESNVSLSFTSCTYTGETVTPVVTVKDKNGTALKNGTDYTVSYCCKDGCKTLGVHKVTVTGKGNFAGTFTKTFTVNAKPEESFIFGDVDCDNKISAADARLALRASVGLEKYTADTKQYKACDVDADGKITAADARLILRASVGLEKAEDLGKASK